MPATSFADMPTLATSSSSSNQQPFHRRRKSWARKIERCFCSAFTLFPLVFVYGLTTWAVWVEVTVSVVENPTWHGYSGALLGFVLYLLANLSYTTAVFTSPGSPLDPKQDLSRARRGGGYQGLPTYENEEEPARIGTVPSEWMTSVTAKSTGKPRYCKKCRVVKPDRTHHCSTCGRCVLKMDHHCPWLATCVGLHNYKPFLLFLIYVCLLCYVCFAISAYWVWVELTNQVQMTEGMRVVNTLLLAVLSGIIGLVLSGFLGWHLYLTATGQTTIESLEKTRYLNPLRKSLQTSSQVGRNYIGQDFPSTDRTSLGDDQPLSDRLKEIHANALPGVLRPEEGDVPLLEPSHNNNASLPRPINPSPAHESLQRSYASLEAQREQDRYNQYLDEQDSEKLPNAFDLGWRRNLLHVFGPNPLLWGLPIRNTSGDGWQWDVSPRWLEARDRISRERQSRQFQQQPQHQQQLHDFPQQQQRPEWRWNPGSGFVDQSFRAQASVPPPVLPPPSSSGGEGGLPQANDRAGVQMQALDRRKMDLADGGSGGDENDGPRSRPGSRTANWNDVPEDFLDSRHGVSGRSRSRGRRKGD